MTPERIAEIRERHRPKPNRDYTDCGECYEEHPCETIQALDALAASSEREQVYRAALEAQERVTVHGETCAVCTAPDFDPVDEVCRAFNSQWKRAEDMRRAVLPPGRPMGRDEG